MESITSGGISDFSKITTPSGVVLPDRSGSKSKSSGESIYVKGLNEDISVNLAQFKQTLLQLKEKRDLYISKLDPATKEMFNNVVSTIQLLYDSGAFPMVFNIVREVFSDVTKVTPGTIGSYFNGCLVSNNFMGNPSCAASCAASVPPPNGTDGWQFCDNLALLWDGTGSFTTLNDPSNKEDAYVFMPNDVTMLSLTPDDVDKLKAYGIRRVQFVKYSDDGRSYTQVNDGFRPLESFLNVAPGSPTGDRSIKAPSKPKAAKQTSSAANAGITVLLIVLIILFLVVAIFIGWKLCSKKSV